MINSLKVCVLVTVTIFLCGFLPYTVFSADHAELFLRTGHSGSISTVAFSPDGTLLASGSADSTIKIWDAVRGKLLRTLSTQSGGIASVTWSPDGERVAAGCYDNSVKVWDVTQGELTYSLEGHEDWVYAVAWSPNGKQLASGSGDQTIRIWDMRRGEALQTLSGHDDWVYAVAWSPNGKRLASGSGDRTVKMWDVAGEALLHTLAGHGNSISSVAWSPNGKTVASGSYDRTIILWNAETGALKETLSGHDDWVTSIAWSPNGSRLVSGSEDSHIKVWDVEDGTVQYSLQGHDVRVSSVSWSSNGSTIASGSEDRSIILWNSSTGLVRAKLSGHEYRVSTVAWSPDGKWFASGSNTVIRVWNVERGELASTLKGHSDQITSVAWNPDGNMLASGSRDQTVKVWGLQRGEVLHTLKGHQEWVSSVSWSPDGKWLASGSGDRTVKIWNIEQEKSRDTLLGHEDWVSSITWSPDSTMLSSGSGDGILNVWDVQANKILHSFAGHTDWIASVRWSPDGAWLASGGGDQTVNIWNVADGLLQKTLTGYDDWISSIDWSPDGKTLALGSYDRTIRLVDVDSGEVRHTLTGHEAWVSSVSWHPDGKTLISGSEDGTSRLWDADSGEIHACFVGLNGDEWLIFHPQRLVYASSERGDAPLVLRFNHALRPLYDIDEYRERLRQQAGVFKISAGVLTRLQEQQTPDKLIEGLTLLEGQTFDSRGKLLAAVQQQIGSKQMEMHQDAIVEAARVGNVFQAFLLPQPDIEDKPFQMWWKNSQHKDTWAIGALTMFLGLFVVKMILRRVFDPMKTAKKFFTRAGYQKIEVLSEKLLLLHPKEGNLKGLATLYSPASSLHKQGIRRWFQHERELPQITADIDRHSKRLALRMKLYLLCQHRIPSGEIVQSLRDQVGYETIPMALPLLQKALFTKHCEQELWELEEPYLTRVDPYTETKPILDPNWFYGRDESLQRVLELAQEGRHIGIFGLSKIGKTSLTHQLFHQLAHIPIVPINCQAFVSQATVYCEKILSRLSAELSALGIKKLPKAEPVIDDEAFRRQFFALFACWERAGHHEPFLLLFDEVEVLFPDSGHEAQQEVLTEYVRLFNVLRDLTQNRRIVTLIVAANRPDVNRREALTPELEKNPLFSIFHEEHLGNISVQDGVKMIHEIGRWKDMLWDEDAAQYVCAYTGGHPFVTRYLAGEACQSGLLKHITADRVAKTVDTLCGTVQDHPICHYYQKRVWEALQRDEQELLLNITRWDATERHRLEADGDVLARLEAFGLVRSQDGKLSIAAKLFEMWLRTARLT